MKRHTLIGATVSFLVISSLGWFRPAVPPAAPVSTQPMIPVDIADSPIPPDPDRSDDPADPGETKGIPAPDIRDTIGPVRPDEFVQPVQPQLPDDVPISHLLVVIPPRIGPGTASGSSKVFDPSMLDQQPEATVRVKPTYPFQAVQNRLAGTVVVDFVVDASGSVRRPYALASSPREFQEAAVEAVRHWKFHPGRRAGQAVASHLQVPIVYHYDDGN
jgi:TonB family protein